MRLPYMQVAPSRTQDMRVGFGGLNLREDAAEGEFAFTQNLSSERYPYVSPRRPRTKFYSTEGGSVNGIFGGADFLLYAVDTGLYRISISDTGPTATQIGTVENNKKQFVRMGAYVLVWPDKAIYNSETGAFEKIEHAYTASGTVTLTQTNLAGEASDTATYIKVAASGIDDGLNDYDGVTLSGLTGSGAAFNGAQVVYAHGEDYIIIAGILEETHSQAGGLTVSRSAPDMDYLTECGNRVWGCSSENHEIYACKLGDPRNWNVFLGLANDSYSATIGSDGDFTAAATINDTVIFFKEDTLHKVLGTKPANYQIHHHARARRDGRLRGKPVRGGRGALLRFPRGRHGLRRLYPHQRGRQTGGHDAARRRGGRLAGQILHQRADVRCTRTTGLRCAAGTVVPRGRYAHVGICARV